MIDLPETSFNTAFDLLVRPMTAPIGGIIFYRPRYSVMISNAFKVEPIIPPLIETGIPEMDPTAEFPTISDIVEDAEDLADEENADVIFRVLQRLESSAAKDLRKDILKAMPPTCPRMILRKKMLRRGRLLATLLGAYRSTDYSSVPGNTLRKIINLNEWDRPIDWYYDDVVNFINPRKLLGEIERLKTRMSGYDERCKTLRPCTECFSCKANLNEGIEHFLEKELPAIVSTFNLEEFKVELLNHI